MIGRALALGLATLLLTTSVASADADSMGGVNVPGQSKEEKEPIDWARHGLYLEFDGLVVFEQFTATTNRGVPISDTGGAVSFRAGWRPTAPLAFEFQYERVFSLYEGTTTLSSASHGANIITISAKYFLFRGRRWQPFIRTGIGSIFGDLPGDWTRKSPVTPTVTVVLHNSFVWKVGGGLDYPINNHVALTAYVDWVVPTQQFHRLNYVGLGFGARYMF